MDFAEKVSEVEAALEENDGRLVPQFVGPRQDTIMTTFTKERNAKNFVKAAIESGLNCWYREGNVSGYVAFINNRSINSASLSGMLSKLPS